MVILQKGIQEEVAGDGRRIENTKRFGT